MAGAEKTGVAWARPNLFERAVCIVTPTPRSDARAVTKVERLWKSVGARVIRLSPAKHDELVSRTSHLPHVLAATLANVVLGDKTEAQQSALCANGFRDTTRIASGSPEMWRDIAIANRRNLRRALDRFAKEIKAFNHALMSGNEPAISKYFKRARQRRDQWVKHAAGRSPE
jgi:prephenate dehydrogenase